MSNVSRLSFILQIRCASPLLILQSRYAFRLLILRSGVT
jgi:hypothetical protein